MTIHLVNLSTLNGPCLLFLWTVSSIQYSSKGLGGRCEQMPFILLMCWRGWRDRFQIKLFNIDKENTVQCVLWKCNACFMIMGITTLCKRYSTYDQQFKLYFQCSCVFAVNVLMFRRWASSQPIKETVSKMHICLIWLHTEQSSQFFQYVIQTDSHASHDRKEQISSKKKITLILQDLRTVYRKHE